MAGKRQHFIPQFYQKGFSELYNKKEQYIWQYRKDGKILHANIKNVGTEGYFYSLNKDSAIDDSITDLENNFAKGIDLIRNGELGCSHDLAKIIAHFEIRTRHIRTSYANASSYMLNYFKENVLNKEFIISYFKRNIISQPQKMDLIFDKQLANSNVPDGLKNIIKCELRKNIDTWLPSVAGDLISAMKNIWDIELTEKLSDVIKTGHLRALESSLFPLVKVEEYSKLEFNILQADYDIPLGDSIVLFEVEGEREFKPFYEKNDVLKNVYLPLSSKSVLCGSSCGNKVVPKNLDIQIAKCSSDFFVAAVNNERLTLLINHIGENSQLLSTDEIDLIMQDAIGELI